MKHLVTEHFYKLIAGLLIVLISIIGYFATASLSNAKQSIDTFSESVKELNHTVIRLDEHFNNHIDVSQKDREKLHEIQGLNANKIENNILNIFSNRKDIDRNTEDIRELKNKSN